MRLRPENLARDRVLLSDLVLVLDAENETLRATIATLKGLIFGARSERLATIGAQQLALDLADEAGAAPSSAAANDDEKAAPGKTRRAPKRNIGALPKHLPRCEQVIEPETTVCFCCSGKMHRIGEEVSEVLDRVPAVLRALRTIRPRYACRASQPDYMTPNPLTSL